jgi:hypothetical protein
MNLIYTFPSPDPIENGKEWQISKKGKLYHIKEQAKQ